MEWHNQKQVVTAPLPNARQQVFTTKVCRDGGSNPDLPYARRNLYLYATAAVPLLKLVRYVYTVQIIKTSKFRAFLACFCDKHVNKWTWI